jgi:hypothetical protein
MNIRKISGVLAGVLMGASVLVACKDNFLDVKPIGGVTEGILKTKAGVEGLLIGAYSLLDGTGSATNNWEAAGSNFIFGSITSDDSYKGSDPSDQQPMLTMEKYETLPSTPYLDEKWRTLYDGVARANDVINFMKDVDLLEADVQRISGEARFLRGHYHFDARQIFEKVPYIDETMVDITDLNTAKVTNDKEIWSMIEADFQYAVENLPETQADAGRANKSAAKAYLAKVYMFQGKFAEALPLLNEVINSGVTARGVKYNLEPNFSDIYRIANKNNQEIVFAYQSSVNDGSGAVNANSAEVLNFPNGGGAPGGCCGFHQPSQNLVNSYKVDAVTGLPLLDEFNQADFKNDNGIGSDEAFMPDTETPVDPRLDLTVGRRGVAYYDWGIHPGASWIRNQTQMGPYSPKKKVFRKSDVGQYTDGTSWTPGYNAQTHAIIRFAEVLLWAAEAEAEAGSLVNAVAHVNTVRRRANNEKVMGRVTGYNSKTDGTLDYTKPIIDEAQPAANYKVSEYTVFPDRDYALKAIRHERKIELAMEGQRFFDLVRWGVAAQVLNNYLAVEKMKRPYLQTANFTEGQDEYFPIPERQINLSQENGQSTLQPNRNR